MHELRPKPWPGACSPHLISMHCAGQALAHHTAQAGRAGHAAIGDDGWGALQAVGDERGHIRWAQGIHLHGMGQLT
eukprot:1080175-Pelagomonas_calceolata.AAC.4